MRGVFRTWVLGPVAYGVTALPLTVVGKAATATRLRRRLIGLDSARTSAGSIAASVLALPLGLLFVYLMYAGWLYPLRPDTIEYVGMMFTPTHGLDSSWGGPTLAGAWAVHAAIAVGMQIVVIMILAGLARIGRVPVASRV